MNKRLFFILTFLTVSSFCFAQKSSGKTLTIQYTIEPKIAEPEKPVRYFSVIQTPLDPLTPEESAEATKKNTVPDAQKAKLAELAKTNLAISGGKYSVAPGTPDWLITLETADATLTSTNEKPLNELEWGDAVFKYTCPAKLTVKDNSGNVILEKVIAGPTEEQGMPKAIMFLNPMYMMKLNLNKNNPEKLKKLTDQLMEKRNHLVLLLLLQKADNALKDAFELQTRTANVTVFSVKGKAYEELNAASEKIFDTYGKFVALSKKNRIPKEEMDKVMMESVPVWEKYIAGNPELEEQTRKGLVLNGALATTWTGDYDKAAGYFSQVSEAKPNTSPQEDEGASTSAATILTFSQSAVNVRNLYESLKEYSSRAKISQ